MPDATDTTGSADEIRWLRMVPRKSCLRRLTEWLVAIIAVLALGLLTHALGSLEDEPPPAQTPTPRYAPPTGYRCLECPNPYDNPPEPEVDQYDDNDSGPP